MDFDFAEPTDGMKAAGFCGNELHVFEENRNHCEARFLGDVIEAWLARADADAVATRAFRKDDEVKFIRGSTKFLQFANTAGIEFAAFEQKADAAAENPFDPGSMPDGFVAENKNGITT